MKRFKPGSKWALIYLVIFMVYVLVAVCSIAFDSATSLLVGILGAIITLPWSLLLGPILDSLGYIAWYDQFVGHPAVYGGLAAIGLLPGALVNACILYYLGARADGGKQLD